MHRKQKDQAGGKNSPTLQVADDHCHLDHLHQFAKEDGCQTKSGQQFHIGSGVQDFMGIREIARKKHTDHYLAKF